MPGLETASSNVETFLEKLSNAFNEATTITVQTFETDLTVDQAGDLQPGVANPAAKPQGLKTEINMLKADITYIQSPGLAAGANLQAVHDKNVALSEQIFRANLKFVVDTVQALLKERAQE